MTAARRPLRAAACALALAESGARVTAVDLDAEGLRALAAQNPLIPAWYDIIWSALCFVIILFVFWKVALPKMKDLLDKRAVAIEGNIAKADEAQRKAEAALEEYTAQLAEARKERNQQASCDDQAARKSGKGEAEQRQRQSGENGGLPLAVERQQEPEADSEAQADGGEENPLASLGLQHGLKRRAKRDSHERLLPKLCDGASHPALFAPVSFWADPGPSFRML